MVLKGENYGRHVYEHEKKQGACMLESPTVDAMVSLGGRAGLRAGTESCSRRPPSLWHLREGGAEWRRRQAETPVLKTEHLNSQVSTTTIFPVRQAQRLRGDRAQTSRELKKNGSD